MQNFWRNEMRCLTNALTQECLRRRVSATWGLLPVVRQCVMDNNIDLKHVRQVSLHQCPQEDGVVNLVVEVIQADDNEVTTHVRHLQGAANDAQHGDYCLYDQRRDGVVEYLHLKH